jgi:hypothetical protein
VSRAPTIQLTVFGLDENGNPLDLSNQFIDVKHNGVRAADARAVGVKPVGTLTVLLLDLTVGVEQLVPEIQQAAETFASAPFMEEQTDFVAIYRVDEIASIEMLAPTGFHNDVRNLFGAGVSTTDGPTALVNSLGDLISRINSLRPKPDMPVSIVVFSDGTDSVSTQFLPDDIPNLANAQGIKLHTVWLENPNLTFSQDAGREYMQELADKTGGINTSLSTPGQINGIWTAISALRNHIVIDYVVDDLLPGTFLVELALPDMPGVPSTSTQIDIPNSIPSITIDVPDEERTLILSDVSEPVKLTFPTSLRWLDEQQRGVVDAQLWLNGTQVATIPPDSLGSFSAELPLLFGENSVQVIIVDDAGQQARSRPLILTVEEGDTSIPAALGGGINWVRIGLIALLALGLLAILIVIFRIGVRWMQQADTGAMLGGLRARFARSENDEDSGEDEVVDTPIAVTPARSTPARPTPDVGMSAETRPSAALEKTQPGTRSGTASIEVLEARSQVTKNNIVDRTEYLIGRSPTVDLAFVNDPSVSRIHATVVQDGAIYRIYDEQSTSGTYVNDREVPEYGLELADGDEIHLGAVHLRFRQKS